MQDKNDKGTPSPLSFNPLTGQFSEMDDKKRAEVEKVMEKVIVKGLSNAEMEDLSKRMNAPAVIVLGFASEFNERGNPMGEFSFNSVGVGENMTTELLDFASHIMKNGYGKKTVDIQVVGGENVLPEIKQRVIADIKKKIENGEIRLDRGGIHGLRVGRGDSADAMAFAMRATKDGMPLRTTRHPQRTPFWKRVVQFFKRPKFTESNLEPAMTFSNVKPPTEKELEEMESVMKDLFEFVGVLPVRKPFGVAQEDIKKGETGMVEVSKDPVVQAGADLAYKTMAEIDKNGVCPICKVKQRGAVSAHIRSKAMWERRKKSKERPYSEFMKRFGV